MRGRRASRSASSITTRKRWPSSPDTTRAPSSRSMNLSSCMLVLLGVADSWGTASHAAATESVSSGARRPSQLRI
ncbi:hypothetical protein ACFPRL_00805 [Pseudoclavibacter helvolus]